MYGGAIFGNGFKARNATFARNYAGEHGGAFFGAELLAAAEGRGRRSLPEVDAWAAGRRGPR